MKQSLLDRIRVLNKHVTNKILIHISGKDLGMFAILSHTGRKTGKIYQIPIIAVPVPGGFVIALTYGKKTDWYENVKAKGGCSLICKRQECTLTNPEFIDKELALQAFPPIFRVGLRLMDIQYYLRLSRYVSYLS
jgi:deazaflavin-dependent oxidoreductase (nitroreductase family)